MLLPLSVPVAVCEAIECLAPVSARIKWPNDIWIDEAKVAGVLIEARPPDWAVIGIGLNVAIEPDEFPADLRWPATSVGHGADVAAARDAICAALGRWVEAPQAAALERVSRAATPCAGREVGWDRAPAIEPGAGVAVGDRRARQPVVETPAGADRARFGRGDAATDRVA